MRSRFADDRVAAETGGFGGAEVAFARVGLDGHFAGFGVFMDVDLY